MIRVRFVYDNKELIKMPRESKLLQYQTEDFYRLVQGSVADEDKKPPFRDEDSVRFIREIDHAEFVEGDWYSVVTPFNRTNMTALCGGTKYALTVIANSRRGFYTSFRGYEKDIWGRLAELSFDVLIFFCVSDLSAAYPVLPIPSGMNESVVIENYRHDGVETEAYLHRDFQGGTFVQDGKLYVENYFPEFVFQLKRDFGLLIAEAEKRLRIFKEFRVQPLSVMSLEAFADTLEEDNAKSLQWYLNGGIEWCDNYKAVHCFLKNLMVYDYMTYTPEKSNVKYPMYLVMKKERHTGACTAELKGGVKYPTFSEAFTEDFIRLPDDEKEDFIKMTIVINAELFWHGAEEFNSALWAFKLYDNIAELYDGNRIYKEFLAFVKQPYEDGMLEVI